MCVVCDAAFRRLLLMRRARSVIDRCARASKSHELDVVRATVAAAAAAASTSSATVERVRKAMLVKLLPQARQSADRCARLT